MSNFGRRNYRWKRSWVIYDPYRVWLILRALMLENVFVGAETSSSSISRFAAARPVNVASNALQRSKTTEAKKDNSLKRSCKSYC